ncbi:MAG: hypothetical protein ABIH63_01770 [archaeon]
MKKGQITLFVILGAVLLILILLVFTFRETLMEQATKVGIPTTIAMSKEAKEVQNEMTRCLRNSAETGLITMALQGGYVMFDPKTPYTEATTTMYYIPYVGTAYLYYKGKNMVPTKETMERQLEGYITANLEICEKDYSGLEVEYGDYDTSVTIEENQVSIDINTKVSVTKEETTSSFRDIYIEVPVRLGGLRDITNQIVEEQVKTGKEGICLSCISRIAANNDVEISIDRVGEDVFYMLTDQKSKLAGENYIFIMANQF